jgi:hypothetical protein
MAENTDINPNVNICLIEKVEDLLQQAGDNLLKIEPKNIPQRIQLQELLVEIQINIIGELKELRSLCE